MTSFLRTVSQIVFPYATIVVVLGIHFYHQMKLGKAIRALEAGYLKSGVVWRYYSDLRLRLKLFNGNDSWIDPTDSLEVQSLKGTVLSASKEARAAIKPMIGTLAFGALVGVVLHLISFAIGG